MYRVKLDWASRGLHQEHYFNLLQLLRVIERTQPRMMTKTTNIRRALDEIKSMNYNLCIGRFVYDTTDIFYPNSLCFHVWWNLLKAISKIHEGTAKHLKDAIGKTLPGGPGLHLLALGIDQVPVKLTTASIDVHLGGS